MTTAAEREILRRIELNGAITFRDFMEIALYHPEGGYYTTKADIWGRAGDYITNADVSPVFARVFAREFYHMWQLCNRPTEFFFVEVGAGRGSFTVELKRAIEELFADFYPALRFFCVERAAKADSHGGAEGVLWLNGLEELGRGFAGIIYSCELLDAMPFHRVVQTEEGLRELFVTYRDGFCEIEAKPSTEELTEHFRELGIELPVGTRAEVSLEAKRWAVEVATALERGFVVTVDYGLPARLLYLEHPAGTLHCHYRHRLGDDPYQRIGRQDITALVDFSSFSLAAKRAGLDTTGFTTQCYYLLSLGILDELKPLGTEDDDVCEKIAHNQGIKELIMPGGLGDTMKVMVQHKAIERPDVRGFSIKDMQYLL